jgi:hypothetical protein
MTRVPPRIDTGRGSFRRDDIACECRTKAIADRRKKLFSEKRPAAADPFPVCDVLEGMAEFHDWLLRTEPHVLPKSKIGEAVS